MSSSWAARSRRVQCGAGVDCQTVSRPSVGRVRRGARPLQWHRDDALWSGIRCLMVSLSSPTPCRRRRSAREYYADVSSCPVPDPRRARLAAGLHGPGFKLLVVHLDQFGGAAPRTQRRSRRPAASPAHLAECAGHCVGSGGARTADLLDRPTVSPETPSSRGERSRRPRSSAHPRHHHHPAAARRRRRSPPGCRRRSRPARPWRPRCRCSGSSRARTASAAGRDVSSRSVASPV